MTTINQYFCIFCEFTCERYDIAFSHYCFHMFLNGNCELCDYDKLTEYVADTSDLSVQCSHKNIQYKKQLMQIKIEVTHYWINKFLSYQKKILTLTYKKLLLENKVCKECAVCRYLLKQYKYYGEDINQIQHIYDNSVKHCNKHIRYNPNSTLIYTYISNYGNAFRLKRIMKLEVFIDHNCDTYFTERYHINTNNFLDNIKKIDENSPIQCSEHLPCSEQNETISKLLPYFEYNLNQSLAPIKTKISVAEYAIADTKSRIEIIDNDLKNIESKFENYEKELDIIKSKINEATPPGTVAYFASSNAPKGWLKSDGKIVSRYKYAKLFESIGTTFGCGDGSTTFKLPDLRGEFIRGWSNGKDVDKTRAFGSFQWGSSIPLGGNGSSSRVGFIGTQDLSFAGSLFDNNFEKNVVVGQDKDGVIYPGDHYINYNDVGSKSHLISWNVLKGTRPRNIALLACIKY